MVQLKRLFAIFALVSIIKCQMEEDEESFEEEEDPEDAAIVSSVIYAPVPTNRVVARVQIPPPEYINGEQKTICHNYNTDFIHNVRGWQVENSMQDTYDIDNYGIKLNLLPPKQFVRKLDKNNLPFNEAGGRGPTLNATTYMRYGKVSATIKTAGTGGSVTAFILLADGGDEIDFEFLGGDVRNVQSNYFWGKTVEYTVNGGLHHVAGEDIDKAYHKYTIDWQPDKITWYVDDNVVRVKTKAETCDSSGSCKFPSQPARVQFGLWDGSIESGTAEWSKGPIDWSQPQSIAAFIKDVRVECHPEYNQIVD